MDPPPFTDQEKRFVLAEAIKTSTVPLEKLSLFLHEGNIHPIWAEMCLPLGRNLKSCMEAFEALRSGPIHSLSSLPFSSSSNKRKSGPDTLDPFAADPSRKRRQSGTDTVISARNIQPKPASNGSPLSYSSPLPSYQPPKKRGRPSKADVEARHAEAILRGEVLPTPKTPVPKGEKKLSGTNLGMQPVGPAQPMNVSAPALEPTPQPPLESRQFEGAQFESAQFDSEGIDSSGKKKRGRPSSRSSKGSKTSDAHFSAINPQVGQPKPDDMRPEPTSNDEEPTPLVGQASEDTKKPDLNDAREGDALKPAEVKPVAGI